HVLDLVGENYKLPVNLIQLTPLELITKLLAAQTERVPPGMLSQHQSRIGDTHRLRCHDLVSERVLQYTVLMNASLVRERVASDDRFVRLYRDSGHFAQHLAPRVELFTRHIRVVGITIGPRPHRHYDLFE